MATGASVLLNTMATFRPSFARWQDVLRAGYQIPGVGARERDILLLRGFAASYDDDVSGFTLRIGPRKNVIQVWCKVP